MYRQCLLKKENSYRAGWIPLEKAVKGKFLKIKLDDVWHDGWEVIQVGLPHDAVSIEEHERDYTKQREASDI
jgi:hypothetical protein